MCVCACVCCVCVCVLCCVVSPYDVILFQQKQYPKNTKTMLLFPKKIQTYPSALKKTELGETQVFIMTIVIINNVFLVFICTDLFFSLWS